MNVQIACLARGVATRIDELRRYPDGLAGLPDATRQHIADVQLSRRRSRVLRAPHLHARAPRDHADGAQLRQVRDDLVGEAVYYRTRAGLEGLPTTSTTDDPSAWEPGGGVAVPSRGGQTLGISGR